MAKPINSQQKRPRSSWERFAFWRRNDKKPNFDTLFVEAVNELQPEWASKRKAIKPTHA